MMKILQLEAVTDLGALAEQRLKESPYFFLRGVRCEFKAGALVLRGSVPYQQLRQFAEAIVARIDGVDEIVNYVTVVDPAVRQAG